MNRRDLLVLAAGATALWPLAARAQQKAMPVIGFLGTSPSAPVEAANLAGFRQGLGDAGYIEGQNAAIEYRWVESHYDRLPALAADLVARKVDLIVAQSDPTARGAKNASATIPIVFFMGSSADQGLVHVAGSSTVNLYITVFSSTRVKRSVKRMFSLEP